MHFRGGTPAHFLAPVALPPTRCRDLAGRPFAGQLPLTSVFRNCDRCSAQPSNSDSSSSSRGPRTPRSWRDLNAYGTSPASARPKKPSSAGHRRDPRTASHRQLHCVDLELRAEFPSCPLPRHVRCVGIVSARGVSGQTDRAHSSFSRRTTTCCSSTGSGKSATFLRVQLRRRPRAELDSRRSGEFFKEGPGVQTVVGGEKLLKRCIYPLANAVVAGIVHRTAHRTGFNSLRTPDGKKHVIKKPPIVFGRARNT